MTHPVAHAAAKAACVPQIETVFQGVTTMTAILSVIAAGIVCGVIGYFIGKRGLTGTKTDLTNAETEVTKVVDAAKAMA